jgi:hypothetical protein
MRSSREGIAVLLLLQSTIVAPLMCVRGHYFKLNALKSAAVPLFYLWAVKCRMV